MYAISPRALGIHIRLYPCYNLYIRDYVHVYIAVRCNVGICVCMGSMEINVKIISNSIIEVASLRVGRSKHHSGIYTLPGSYTLFQVVIYVSFDLTSSRVAISIGSTSVKNNVYFKKLGDLVW